MVMLKIEKLVFGGQGMGRLKDGRVCFVWNALPGEEVEVDIIKDKKDFCEGIARKIITTSPFRIEPKDKHFLACSPWQILSPEQEDKWKVEMSKENYKKFANLDWDLSMETDGVMYGYRNKMEFNFVENNGKISLAFFAREQKNKQAIDSCALASDSIGMVANMVLEWVNKNKIPVKYLRSLVLRSDLSGKVIGALFVTTKMKFEFPIGLDKNLVGFKVYYCHYKSKLAVPTKQLYSIGSDHLMIELNNVQLKFGALSFFQINTPVFEMALSDIKQFLDKSKDVVDYYSGVGAIGLSLREYFKSAILVESNGGAVQYAKDNIVLNNITNCEARLSSTEKMLDLISSDKVIIFDPPRAGLDKSVVEKVLEVGPERIIYMSCNPSTQARDIKLLSNKYNVKFLKLYNFFPRTPHVEALCVLELK